MDKVFIKELRVETIIGVFDWERKVRQLVSIDLEMAADIRRAAATGRLEDDLDYKSISKRVTAFVADSRFHLVETLAESIAGLILAEFPTHWVRLTLHKPGALRGATDVGIIIERSSD